MPPNTHDWRLYIKPHEISFVLQSHGFLCDTRQFRGMRPSFGALPNAMLMRSLPAKKKKKTRLDSDADAAAGSVRRDFITRGQLLGLGTQGLLFQQQGFHT